MCTPGDVDSATHFDSRNVLGVFVRFRIIGAGVCILVSLLLGFSLRLVIFFRALANFIFWRGVVYRCVCEFHSGKIYNMRICVYGRIKAG